MRVIDRNNKRTGYTFATELKGYVKVNWHGGDIGLVHASTLIKSPPPTTYPKSRV